MRFGIFDHMERRDEPPGVQLENRLQMLEFADAAGYWCYHKAEHHFTVLDIAPSSNVFLAAASQRTSNIRFGPMVYLLPFYDPLRLVEEICVLDHLSGGRLEIGSAVASARWSISSGVMRQQNHASALKRLLQCCARA